MEALVIGAVIAVFLGFVAYKIVQSKKKKVSGSGGFEKPDTGEMNEK